MIYLPATRPSDAHSYEHPVLPELHLRLARLCHVFSRGGVAGGAFQSIRLLNLLAY